MQLHTTGLNAVLHGMHTQWQEQHRYHNTGCVYHTRAYPCRVRAARQTRIASPLRMSHASSAL